MKYWIIAYIVAVIINYWLIKKYVRPKVWSWVVGNIGWDDVMFTLLQAMFFPIAWLIILTIWWGTYDKTNNRSKVPKWLVFALLIGMNSSCSLYSGSTIVSITSKGALCEYGVSNSLINNKVDCYFFDTCGKHSIGDTIAIISVHHSN